MNLVKIPNLRLVEIVDRRRKKKFLYLSTSKIEIDYPTATYERAIPSLVGHGSVL